MTYDTREFWTKRLREAEAELDAATKPSELNAAARKLQAARAQLKRFEGEPERKPKRSRP